MNLILTNHVCEIYDSTMFENINSLKELYDGIECYRKTFEDDVRQSLGITGKLPRDLQRCLNDHSNVIAGSIFEIFIIGLCILRGKTDSNLLIDNIVSVDTVEKDYGIDIYAKTTDKKLLNAGRENINIQVKYTSKDNKTFSMTELSTFATSSHKDVENSAKHFSNTIFITNGAGINHHAAKNFTENSYNGISGKMRVISKQHLNKMFHKSGSFFDEFRDLLKKSAEYIKTNNKKRITFNKREFQDEVIDQLKLKLKSNNKATIIVPTGGGKTVLGARIIDDVFNNGGTLAVVHAPTILLTKQYIDSLRGYFGDECDYLRICSDQDRDQNSLYETITLYDNVIKISILSSIIRNRKLIVVVTYQSYGKFYNVLEKLNISADIGIFDEAHHIVYGGLTGNTTDNNWKTFKKIDDDSLCDDMVMFTATPYFDPSIKYKNDYCPSKLFPINLKDTASMNNIFRFGEMIVVPTSRLLNEGFILPTNIIFLDSSNKIPNIDVKFVQNIIDTVCDQIDEDKIVIGDKVKKPTVEEIFSVLFTMDYLYKEVKKYNENNKVKLLYPAASTTIAHALNHILTEIFDKIDIKENIFNEEIYIDSMSSDYAQMDAYSKLNSREEILKEMEKDKHCIIIHYDMLSEGIDVPSVTGTILGRHMNETKTIQTNGRAVRLCEHDAKLVNKAHLENKQYIFSPKNKTFRENVMHKPYSYFVIQVTGDTNQIVNQVKDYFKIYKGTADYAFGDITYQSISKTNDDVDELENTRIVVENINHSIESLPNYIFRSEEYSTFLEGEEDENVEKYISEYKSEIDEDVNEFDFLDDYVIYPEDYGCVDSSGNVDLNKMFQMISDLSKKYPDIDSSIKQSDNGKPIIYMKRK